MLQRNLLQTDERAPLSDVAHSDQTEGGISDLVNFALGFVRRQYLVIIVTTALAMAASIVYLLKTPPTYTARVQILLANPRAQFVQQQSLLAEPQFDFSQIETQIQLIKSRAIAVAVINQLKLADDADLKGPGVSFSSLWHRLRAWISPQPEGQELDGLNAPGQLVDGMIEAFQDQLSVSQIGVSNVIEISVNSNSAERAAEIANATAKAYIADQRDAKFEASRTAASWLQDRLSDLGKQALEAERAVSAYKSEHNIVSSGGKPINDQQVTDLNGRLVAARAQTTDLSAKLARYEAILHDNSEDSQSIGTLDAASADILNSPIINNLREQYLEFTRRERDWSARFGYDHQAVANLRTQMRELRKSILDEVRRLAEITRSEFEVAQQRQQELEKQLTGAVSQSRSTSSAELTIRDLESRAKELRSLYETFLQRYMGSAQQESFPISETRVVYPASPPHTKSKPKSRPAIAAGIIGGLVLGIALGLLREIMDRGIRTPKQIESALGLSCLSVVPLQGDLNSPEPTAASPHVQEDLRRRIISNHGAVRRAVVRTPLSRYTEAIRSIKLAIDVNPGASSNRVIGITSALPNEGKTTIAASLAQLIGHSGGKVIVVDCDLRNPSLSASLAPEANAGLLEVIDGTRSLEETLWRDPKTNLAFLPTVRHGPLFHTSEILATGAVHRLFDELRATYDYIIVDLPPLAPLVDVRVTASLVDCYILVVEWGRTKVEVLQHALHTAPNVYECLIGTVLNKTDIKALTSYDACRSDYYSDEHYSRYGFSDVKLSATDSTE